MELLVLDKSAQAVELEQRFADTPLGLRLRRFGLESAAIGLTLVSVVLVVASQLNPWFKGAINAGEENGGRIPLTEPAPTAYLPAFALLWFALFGTIAVMAYGPARLRRPLFGLGAAALMAQGIVVAGMLKQPGAGDAAISLFVTLRAQATYRHVAGSYLVIAAFVPVALALVLLVGGRIMPGSPEPAVEADEAPADSAFARSTDPEPAVTTDRSEDPEALLGEMVRIEESPAEPPQADHRIYMRPEPAPVPSHIA